MVSVSNIEILKICLICRIGNLKSRFPPLFFFFLKQCTCCKPAVCQHMSECPLFRMFLTLYVFGCVQCLWCHGGPALTSASGILSYTALRIQTLSSPALTGTVRWVVSKHPPAPQLLFQGESHKRNVRVIFHHKKKNLKKRCQFLFDKCVHFF